MAGIDPIFNNILTIYSLFMFFLIVRFHEMVKDMLAAADDDILVVDSDSDLSHEPIQVSG